MSSEDQQVQGLEEQNKKFAYKAPESVYQKHDPSKSATASGKAFTGVSPMDFYMRQNQKKKAERAKEQETKVGVYKNDMAKAFFS